MKKTVLQFMACMLLTVAALGIISIYQENTVFAGALQIPESEHYGDIPMPSTEEDTLTLLKEGILGDEAGALGILGVFKYIIGAIAVLMIVISGFRLVIAQGDEESVTKNKKALLVGVVGLVLISMASEVGKILTLEGGGPLKDPNKMLSNVVNFDKKVRIIITFIKYVIGGIAVLMAIKSGLTLVTRGENEEEMTKEKKKLGLLGAGLVLIVMADTIIRKVFYKIDTTTYPGVEGVKPALDPYRGVAEIVGITNFVVTFISPVAILVFLIGGIMYLTAGGEEEKMTKARRMMIAAGIGIIVIYGAFALVSTFISGKIGTPLT